MEIRDPVFNEVLGIQIKELKGCPVCTKRLTINGKIVCRNGLRYPSCKESRKGFKLDSEA